MGILPMKNNLDSTACCRPSGRLPVKTAGADTLTAWHPALFRTSALGRNLTIVRNACRLSQFLGPYVGTILARLLYIMLAAKAVALILAGAEQFYRKLQNA